MYDPISQDVRELAKAIFESKHGGAHFDPSEFEQRMLAIVKSGCQKPPAYDDRVDNQTVQRLTEAIKAQTDFLRANLSAVKKADLQESVNGLLGDIAKLIPKPTAVSAKTARLARSLKGALNKLDDQVADK
jgi:hypothetical protein